MEVKLRANNRGHGPGKSGWAMVARRQLIYHPSPPFLLSSSSPSFQVWLDDILNYKSFIFGLWVMEIGLRQSSIISKKKTKQDRLKQVEWCGGAETMEEILAKVHQREEAAVKREREPAQYFKHATGTGLCHLPINCSGGPTPSMNQVQSYEFGRGNCGWSWIDRWIAYRPWEVRIYRLQKAQSKAASKTIKNVNTSTTAVKPPNLNKEELYSVGR